MKSFVALVFVVASVYCQTQQETAEEKRIDVLATELLDIQIQTQLFSDYIGREKTSDGYVQVEEAAIRGLILRAGQLQAKILEEERRTDLTESERKQIISLSRSVSRIFDVLEQLLLRLKRLEEGVNPDEPGLPDFFADESPEVIRINAIVTELTDLQTRARYLAAHVDSEDALVEEIEIRAQLNIAENLIKTAQQESQRTGVTSEEKVLLKTIVTEIQEVETSLKATLAAVQKRATSY